jgi:hypothetical protein
MRKNNALEDLDFVFTRDHRFFWRQKKKKKTNLKPDSDAMPSLQKQWSQLLTQYVQSVRGSQMGDSACG